MKTKNIFKTLALAMLMPTMLLTTACSNSDDIVNTEKPANTKGYALPVTVNVTRHGGDATRATYDESTKKLSFSTGDKLFIEGYQSFAGMLTMVSDGKFTGEILTETPYTGTVEDLLTNDEIEINAYLLPAGYENYGFLNIVDKDTYHAYLYYDNSKVFALTKKEAVEQLSFENHWDYDTSLKGFELMPATAILNFTISGLAANTAVSVSFGNTNYDDATPVNITTDASGVATFAAAMRDQDNFDDYSLTVDGTAIALPANREVEAGKIYNISRSVAPATPALTLTSPTVGQVIGSDGKNYAAGATLPDGVNKVAMIAYVNGSNGLAIALADEGLMNWATAKSTCEAKTPVFSNSTWKLPTQEEWNQMFNANGGSAGYYTGLNTALAAAGGDSSKLQEDDEEDDFYYWSSTPDEDDFARCVNLDGVASWYTEDMGTDLLVRACLAF